MKRHFSGTRACALAAFTLFAGIAHAQSSLPEKTLIPITEGLSSRSTWGSSVSLLGGRAVVGMPGRTAIGEVFVFEQSGGNWIQKQRLETPQPDVERGKGMGDVLVQDANSILTSDSTYGFVYYFEKSGSGDFRPKAILRPGTAVSGFGTSLAMSGCVVAVGSENRPDPIRPGAVHLYDRCKGNMVWQGALYAPGSVTGDLFSYSIALLGNEMMVGAPGIDGRAGAVFYYTYNGTAWTLKQKIVQAKPAAGNRFGEAVSFRDGLAVIGAPDQPDVGQAEIFKRGSNGRWSSLGLLTPSGNDGTWRGFGRKLVVTPGYVVVAGISVYPVVEAAKAFVYRRTGDTLTPITTLAFTNESEFSSDISLDVAGRGLIVGNPTADPPGVSSTPDGRTTIYQLPP